MLDFESLMIVHVEYKRDKTARLATRDFKRNRLIRFKDEADALRTNIPTWDVKLHRGLHRNSDSECGILFCSATHM